MNTQELLEIYRKEHVKYTTEHKGSTTGKIEELYEPLAEAFLKRHFNFVEKTGNSFLNHLGADYVVKKNDEMYTVDLKGIGGVCPKGRVSFEMKDLHFAIDTHKKNYNSEGYHPILEDKITDFYLCINKYYYCLIPRYIMEIILKTLEEKSQTENVYFFFNGDKNYKTMKAVFDMFELNKTDFENIIYEPLTENEREYLLTKNTDFLKK